jgi:hypothetical protein
MKPARLRTPTTRCFTTLKIINSTPFVHVDEAARRLSVPTPN